MFSLAMTVQLEYINHLLQFFKNISYYAGIMLDAFSDLLCSKLCWHNRLVPNWCTVIVGYQISMIIVIADNNRPPVIDKQADHYQPQFHQLE